MTVPDKRTRRVLVLADWYLPGTNAGGPVRSLSGLVESLGNEIEFLVVANGHDLGDDEPYSGVRFNGWNRVGSAQVAYLTPGARVLPEIRRLAHEVEHDVVYLNSIFSPLTRAYLLLRRAGLVPSRRVIVAPRGELGERALKLKPMRKAAFLTLARAIRLFDGVSWSPSSVFERQDIAVLDRRLQDEVFQREVPIVPNIVRHRSAPKRPEEAKRPGSANLIFVSRISRKKNLDGALRSLAGVTARIRFDIYGPAEDAVYVAECRALAARLPSNVTARFLDAVPADVVTDVIARYDLLFLPTLNENFGHVIIEAMLASTPVLISDQTAWRGLEAERAGWDLPLQDDSGFRSRIERVASMSADELAEWRHGAFRYAERSLESQQAVSAHRALFADP